MPIEHSPTCGNDNLPGTVPVSGTQDQQVQQAMTDRPDIEHHRQERCHVDDHEVQAYALRAVKTCTFWRDHSKTWFNQLKAKFRAHNIRSDDLKFCVVVDNLDKESMLEIADIIELPPATDKYNKLKETLISCLTDSDKKRWKKLLTDVELGDRKPTHLLREMKRLTRNAVDNQLLQTLWLQRLPQRVQEILAVVEGVALKKLAELADKAIERTTPGITAVSSLAQAGVQTLSPSAIEKLTQQIQNLVTIMNKERRSRSRSDSCKERGRTRSPSQSKSNSNQYCYYHARFGDKAKKCTKPCTWIKTLKAADSADSTKN